MKKRSISINFLFIGISVIIVWSCFVESGLVLGIPAKPLRLIGHLINFIVNASFWCAFHYKKIDMQNENSSSCSYKLLSFFEIFSPFVYIISLLTQI